MRDAEMQQVDAGSASNFKDGKEGMPFDLFPE